MPAAFLAFGGDSSPTGIGDGAFFADPTVVTLVGLFDLHGALDHDLTSHPPLEGFSSLYIILL